jgi:hypothetical protein
MPNPQKRVESLHCVAGMQPVHHGSRCTVRARVAPPEHLWLTARHRAHRGVARARRNVLCVASAGEVCVGDEPLVGTLLVVRCAERDVAPASLNLSRVLVVRCAGA